VTKRKKKTISSLLVGEGQGEGWGFEKNGGKENWNQWIYVEKS